MTSQKQTKATDEILQGNLIQLMLKLSIPGILGMLLIGLNTFVDALFAGRLIGESALAAISLALPLTTIVIGCALLVGIGSASVLSRAIGAGDIKTQSKIFGTFIVLSLIISFFITILGYGFGDRLISFMGGEGEVALLGADYFKTYMLGSVFLVLAIGSSQLIKSEGKIGLAAGFSAIYVLTNTILNPIFVAVFHWGIRGIAWATVVASMVYAIVNITYFISGKSSTPVQIKKLTLSADLLSPILSVGMSVLIMELMTIVQQVVIFKSIAYYGTDTDIAFAGATLNLYSLALTPVFGFVYALQPVIGINYGAGSYQRMKKGYLIFGIGGTVLLSILWLPLQLFPETFLGLLLPKVAFTANDILNFRIVIIMLPLLSFIFCGITLFQSIGNGKIAGIIVVARQVFLFIPVVLIWPLFMGINGIYYSLTAVDILIFLIVALFSWRELARIQLQILAK
ncbi:MAG: MATE family efflux transporter [Oscillatoriales cyanobacterium]|uniref:MATE family efflux transporter n=1 Tax=unclassified Microcoleus TaxID=2642155 RepID=UPI001D4ED42E|nr:MULTISPECIES: MATE family efflux transporter [unclassified Microcoleus]TAG08056.1 MAG: MATE family efflux transporter [Oscillatoriales cyanobacterium]MCC3434002.1 MATE family efflux transporter [Microcoleus sp. PH2017_05_CCC_O_A]MCC3583545.1 MATE family efflux transporter [Microcoleus sp. PH2017_30_WIL_O_A]TAG17503.1 MAG: MATE family efflux transporter [Oscillatoriales cyanobacterium]TAG45616.1 MAG: MATE family efflux transporter [Oscillatoriales cyanobacterium]